MKLCSLLLLAGLAHAVGTVQTSLQPLATDSQGRVITMVAAWNWTGDASNGSVPSTAIQLSCCTGYFVFTAEFVPQTPAPTSGYSAVITDAAGVDVLGGAANSLSATASQGFAASTSASPIQGTLTLTLSGQNAASAKGVVFVYMIRPGTSNLAALLRGSAGGGGGGSVTSVGLSGTPNQITVSGGTPITSQGSWILSIPTNPTLPGTTTSTFSGNLTGNVTGNVSGSAATITGALTLANTPLTTNQDILYDNTGVLGRLPIVTPGSCLGNNGGVWGPLVCAGGTGGTISFQGTPTASALLTDFDPTHIQTPNSTATMDSGGNISTPGSLSTGVGAGGSGIIAFPGGTQSVSLVSAPSNSTGWIGPATVAAGKHFFAPPSTGGSLANQIMLFGTEVSNVSPAALVTFSSTNLTDGPNLVRTIASGTTAATGAGSINNLGAIATAACATLTVSATGVATTDVIDFTPNGSIKGLAGFVPATTGGLTIAAYPTANNINFDVCNWTSGSITPGQIQLNWKVPR